jgi:hypothetical protein
MKDQQLGKPTQIDTSFNLLLLSLECELVFIAAIT